MAQMFEDEKKFPDNGVRENFVFLGYPFSPPLPQDDYRAVTAELQQELPIRLWYFLDEVTTQELMRKIWRAILRADLAIFDISRGNPNVAFELGLAAAIDRQCITLLKTGEPNPLGGADLSYSERAEYQSRESLKNRLRELVKAKSSGLRTLNRVSYAIQSDVFPYARSEIEGRLAKVVLHAFLHKRLARANAATIFGNDTQAGIALNALRQEGVLRLEGQRRAAKWLLGEKSPQLSGAIQRQFGPIAEDETRVRDHLLGASADGRARRWAAATLLRSLAERRAVVWNLSARIGNRARRCRCTDLA